MTLDFDPADLGVVDGAEPVTLERVGLGGTTTVAIAAALRGPRQRQPPTASGGVSLEPESIVWHLPSAALGAIEPRAGDTLIAGAESFVVVAAARVTLGTRWRVVTHTLRG